MRKSFENHCPVAIVDHLSKAHINVNVDNNTNINIGKNVNIMNNHISVVIVGHLSEEHVKTALSLYQRMASHFVDEILTDKMEHSRQLFDKLF